MLWRILIIRPLKLASCCLGYIGLAIEPALLLLFEKAFKGSLDMYTSHGNGRSKIDRTLCHQMIDSLQDLTLAEVFLTIHMTDYHFYFNNFKNAFYTCASHGRELPIGNENYRSETAGTRLEISARNDL